jgi:hypothetical protein
VRRAIKVTQDQQARRVTQVSKVRRDQWVRLASTALTLSFPVLQVRRELQVMQALQALKDRKASQV